MITIDSDVCRAHERGSINLTLSMHFEKILYVSKGELCKFILSLHTLIGQGSHNAARLSYQRLTLNAIVHNHSSLIVGHDNKK